MELSDSMVIAGERDQHPPYKVKGVILNGKKYNDPWKCPQCFEEDYKKQQEEKMDEERKYKIMEYFERANIPPRFEDKTFENFKVENAQQELVLRAAKEYVENFVNNLKAGKCLILSGYVGSGKTHIAIATMKEIIKQCYGAEFYHSLDVIRIVRQTWKKQSDESEMEVIRGFGSPSLLVLDEIGMQYGTEGEKIIIYEILNHRYLEVKPTIMITNFGIEELQSYIGERALDRLRENGGKVLLFDWSSYRK